MDRYERAARGLRARGIPMPHEPRKLGNGGYATVYETDDGRVCKITSDETERWAARLVQQKPQKHLVRVDEVFRMGHGPDSFGHTVMICERLLPYNPAEPGNPWPFWMHPVDERHGQDVFSKASPWMIEQLKGITASFEAAGITQAYDLHRNNVMQRADGTLVISDLGCTRSKGMPGVEDLPDYLVDQDGGDECDWRAPKPAPKAPELDYREVKWHQGRDVRHGETFRVAHVDKIKGTVWLDRVPAAKEQPRPLQPGEYRLPPPPPRWWDEAAAALPHVIDDAILRDLDRRMMEEVAQLQDEMAKPRVFIKDNLIKARQGEPGIEVHGERVKLKTHGPGAVPCGPPGWAPTWDEVRREERAHADQLAKLEASMLARMKRG